MNRLIPTMLLACSVFAQMKVAALPGKSPLVTFRIVFTTGSASDPEGRPGTAYLTAMMLAQGGTRELAYKQILDSMFPMAASVSAQVDKEMTAFYGTTHVDNLEAYYKIFRAMLLDPGWRNEDFARVKDDAINALRVGLRGNNDEELGKEALYNAIYPGTLYGHYSIGTVSSLEKITIDDLKEFYHRHYSQASLILGLAGGYPQGFLERVKSDFRETLPQQAFALRLTPPRAPQRNRALLIDKDTRSVAYSLGFPINVRRNHPDYPALLVAMSYFGQHRNSGGRLYNRMRELRGLNYGDYAYIEYFPRGMFQFEPSPNLGRQFQIFQIWIRPVEPPNAVFALRLAMYELNKLVKEGLSKEDFARSREFVSKYVNLLMKTKNAELGYAIDSLYYDIPPYTEYLQKALAGLTREQVNDAIRRNLHPDRLQIVAVTKNAEELKRKLAGGEPSPITYNSSKPEEILAEDKIVEKWELGLRPEDITIVPVDRIFE